MAISDDNKLVEQILNGNQQAFATLVDRHKGMVLTIISRIVGQRQEAEDVAQEVFVKVYHSLSKFRKEAKFSTWLYRIAYNAAISQTRSRKFKFSEQLDDENSYLQLSDNSEFEALETLSREERFSVAQQLIEALPEGDKLLIQLFYFDQQTVDQVAEILALSVSNVKVKLHRIRKRLQQEMSKTELVNTY